MDISQDSKRFEGIDTDFKELAYDAHKTPNVVEATNKPGLYNRLEDIQSRFIACFYVFFFFFLVIYAFSEWPTFSQQCNMGVNVVWPFISSITLRVYFSPLWKYKLQTHIIGMVLLPAGWLSVRKLWLNIWIQSGWLSPGSTSSRLPICWIFCPMAPTLSR